jgi:predicted nucleic acid-binding protein
MVIPFPIRVVLDTNVVFEGLTNRGGSCGLIIDLRRAGVLQACVSDTLV